MTPFWKNENEKKKEELHKQELSLQKREREFRMEQDTQSAENSTHSKVIEEREKRADMMHETNSIRESQDKEATVNRVKMEAELAKRRAEGDATIARDKAEANIEAEQEKAHKQEMLEDALKGNRSENTRLLAENDAKKIQLKYTQDNIDALLGGKNGEIRGLQESLSIVDRELRVKDEIIKQLIEKMPNVDLKDFNINIEMPAPAGKNTQQQNKKDKGKENQSKE